MKSDNIKKSLEQMKLNDARRARSGSLDGVMNELGGTGVGPTQESSELPMTTESNTMHIEPVQFSIGKVAGLMKNKKKKKLRRAKANKRSKSAGGPVIGFKG